MDSRPDAAEELAALRQEAREQRPPSWPGSTTSTNPPLRPAGAGSTDNHHLTLTVRTALGEVTARELA